MNELVLVIIYGLLIFLVLTFISVYFFIFIYPLKAGAPYIPTDYITVAKMVKLANIKPGQKAADLGSGDGRIVIELAKSGAEAHGYEISPFLVIHSLSNIKKAKLDKTAFIHKQDFKTVNFSDFDAVMVYQLPFVLKFMATKLKNELKSGTRVVSNGFLIPELGEPDVRDENVLVYIIK